MAWGIDPNRAFWALVRYESCPSKYVMPCSISFGLPLADLIYEGIFYYYTSFTSVDGPTGCIAMVHTLQCFSHRSFRWEFALYNYLPSPLYLLILPSWCSRRTLLPMPMKPAGIPHRFHEDNSSNDIFK